jgi:carbonic anhydrase
MLARLFTALMMTLLLSTGAPATSDGASALKQALARRHAKSTQEASASADSHARSTQDASATTQAQSIRKHEEARPTAPAHASPGTDHATTATPAAEPNNHEARPAAPAHASSEADHGVSAKPSTEPNKDEVEVSPEGIWEDLLKGNMRFVMGEPQPRLLISSRQRLVYGQQPKAIILTCSDSRVSPELLFDEGLGDLFVVRTAGNVADPVALGSIEYAAEHLHVTLLVILGHEKCGAVAAAASGAVMPSPNLEAIVSKIRPAIEKLKGRATGDELLHLAAEGNVHQSAEDVIANSPIVRESVETGKLMVIKAFYDLKTGQVTTLSEAYPS